MHIAQFHSVQNGRRLHERDSCFSNQVQAEMTDSSSVTITQRGITDDMRKLLVVPQNHILALPRKKWLRLSMELKKDGQDIWQHLGRKLQISEDDLCELEVSSNVKCTSGDNWC